MCESVIARYINRPKAKATLDALSGLQPMETCKSINDASEIAVLQGVGSRG